MPLLDHFRKPVSEMAPATSIGSYWIVNLAKWINERLVPYGYRAFANVHLGPVESDITEYELLSRPRPEVPESSTNALSLLPEPLYTLESLATEVFEIQIHRLKPDKKLVAVIEVVSAANKDRETSREQFVAKCLNLLQNDVGVVVLDLVTNRKANLHNDIVERLGAADGQLMDEHWTYVVAYRPTASEDSAKIDVWPYPAVVGLPIPAVPMPIRNGPPLMLDLESTYSQTLVDNGIPEEVS